MAWLAALALAACDGPAPERGSTLPPLVFLGIDGADWGVIDAMIAAGELPHLARLKRDGTWGELINPGPQVSPVVWTTFMTGEFGRRHGVLDHVYPYDDGSGKRRVTSELRQLPALWNVADHHGLRTHVVGYFVSHPPERINGVVVSELAPQWVDDAVTPSRGLDLRDERYQSLHLGDEQSDLLRRFFGFPFSRDQAEDPDHPNHASAMTIVERNLDYRVIADEFLRRASRELAADPVDLHVTYLRLVDFFSHSLWHFHEPGAFDEAPPADGMAHFGETIREGYRYADEMLGELLEDFGPDANVIVVSDHGFGPRIGKRPHADPRRRNLTGDHRPNGIFAAIGPDFAPGEIRGLTIMEIAPAMAALLGLPVSDEWPGRVPEALFRDGFFDDVPLRTVATLDDVGIELVENQATEATEEQSLESLRGLGYIGEGVELGADTHGGGYDFWRASDRLIIIQLHAEAVYYLLNGEAEVADQVVALLDSKRPDLVPQLLAWVRVKYRTLRQELPDGYFDAAPFDAFLSRHAERGTAEEPVAEY